MLQDKNYAGIYSDENKHNPTLISPFTPEVLPFYETYETLVDTDSYRLFLNSAIREFRKSRTYTNYKAFLMSCGLDRCQIFGNILSDDGSNDGMAKIEMHHHVLTIFDIALIITEHVLNTYGRVSTFDVIKLLKNEHKNHRVMVVMLSLTAHQVYHEENFFIHPNQCVGDLNAFLEKYHKGVTYDIALKLLRYIDKAMSLDKSDDQGMLDLREKIKSWGNL